MRRVLQAECGRCALEERVLRSARWCEWWFYFPLIVDVVGDKFIMGPQVIINVLDIVYGVLVAVQGIARLAHASSYAWLMVSIFVM